MTKEELNAHIEKRYSECHKRSQGLSYGSFYDGYMDCYCEQQKENAELIHENARLVTVIDKSKSWGISPLNALIINNLDTQLIKAKELLLELYDCIPSSMADSCKETLQKVALFFKDSEVEK